MKLGEALTIRARQAQRLNDLAGRIKASATAQEGDQPAEDAQALIDTYLSLSDEQSLLVARITKTNVATLIQVHPTEATTLLDLLQSREHLIRQRNLYGSTAHAASNDPNALYRYSRSEIKMVAQVNVQQLRSFEESTNTQVASLDLQIQQINWNTDLL